MGQSSLYDFFDGSPPHTRDEIVIDTVGKGYTAVHPFEDPEQWCYVHRLSAVAEYGLDAVQKAEQVHHRDGCKWVNTPENLALESLEGHADRHDFGGDTTPQNQF